MTVAAAKLLEQALELTPEERIDLAAELLASVEEPPARWADAWRAELARRRDERTVSAEHVRERLLARFVAR